MTERFEPKLSILPKAQQEIWPQLAPAPSLSLVLYGGTAVALHLGHRISVDFDFFTAAPLDKAKVRAEFAFMKDAQVIQDETNTLVVIPEMLSGPVKVSFFGGISIGRINDPILTKDKTLLVASLEDLLATKLKSILDRAEAKDYRDISEILRSKVSLEKSLGAFTKMYGEDAALPLRAIGFFKDGDLPNLPEIDKNRLRSARDHVNQIPVVRTRKGLTAN
jgi:hypothetical protein